MRKLANYFILAIIVLVTLFRAYSMWVSHVEDTGIDQVNEGNKLLKAGDPDLLQKAVTAYKKAIDIFHGIHDDGERRNEGLASYNLAKAYHALKQDPQAASAGERAIPLLTDAKSKGDLADVYRNLGVYYDHMSQHDKALDAYQHAEPLYQETNQTDGLLDLYSVEGTAFYNKAAAAAGKHDWPAALPACVRATELYHKARNKSDEADAWHKLGMIYTALQDAPHSADANSKEIALRAALPAVAGK